MWLAPVTVPRKNLPSWDLVAAETIASGGTPIENLTTSGPPSMWPGSWLYCTENMRSRLMSVDLIVLLCLAGVSFPIGLCTSDAMKSVFEGLTIVPFIVCGYQVDSAFSVSTAGLVFASFFFGAVSASVVPTSMT